MLAFAEPPDVHIGVEQVGLQVVEEYRRASEYDINGGH